MTRKLILATVLLLSFTMVSCGTSKTSPDNSSSTPSISEENSDNNKDTSSKKEQDKTTDSENNKNNSTSKDESKTEQVKLPIYSIDDNTTKSNEVGNITVDKNSTLENKLNELGKKVSQTSFNGLPITVKSIDTVDGKRIATINLTDSGDQKWSQMFQGSTGGEITTSTLIENFLQRNNKSDVEWIDGVKFLYNNETIEYEHAYDLANVQYRN